MAHPNMAYAYLAHPNIEYANMAHPNMEDAHVAPLYRPDGEFAYKKVSTIMSKTWAWIVLGPK